MSDETNAGVAAAAAHDVRLAIFEAELDRDVRILLDEAREDGREIGRVHRARQIDPQQPGRAARVAAEILHRRRDPLDRRARLRQKTFTGLRQAHAARGTGEERDAEAALELLDDLADRRRRDVSAVAAAVKLRRSATSFGPAGRRAGLWSL